MEKVTGSVTVQRRRTHLDVGERSLSAVLGVLSALYGLRQKDAAGLGLIAAGAYLLYRAATGRCYVYQLLGVRGRAESDLVPVEKGPPASVKQGDEVTESSWESFPTSDPPSWTLGREDE